MPKQQKRQKCSTCSTGWCKNHVFQLKPLTSSLYFRKIQRVRLCPRHNKAKNHFEKSTPLLNKDKKYYTPTFILQEEISFYADNDQKMLKNHEQKIDDMIQGDTKTIVINLILLLTRVVQFTLLIYSQWIAKHGRKRKYCSVCHTQYEDYLQHIHEINHKEKINKSKYTGFIHEMAINYERKDMISKNETQQTADVKPERIQQAEQIIQKQEIQIKQDNFFHNFLCYENLLQR